MDYERIKVIRDRNEKKQRKNEANYMAGGEIIYSSRAHGFEELVEICDIALSVAKIRDQNHETSMKVLELGKAAKAVYNSCGRCNQDVELLCNKILKLAKDYGYNI